MVKPDLTGCTKAQLDYIDYLEKKLEGLNENGAILFMAALNRKLKTLSQSVDDMDIDLQSKDDKTFDRFIKMVAAGSTLVADFKSFNQQYGEQLKDATPAKRTPIEERFNR